MRCKHTSIYVLYVQLSWFIVHWSKLTAAIKIKYTLDATGASNLFSYLYYVFCQIQLIVIYRNWMYLVVRGICIWIFPADFIMLITNSEDKSIRRYGRYATSMHVMIGNKIKWYLLIFVFRLIIKISFNGYILS